jgi:hypothetical protein
MNKNKEDLNPNNSSNIVITKLALEESFKLITNIFEAYIYTSLCIVEEITIPDDVPKLKFNNLLADIFNIFKQNYPAFPENLKSIIKELVLETLKEMCNDATDYILKKVNTSNNISSNIKIFKTKIIINKSTQEDKPSANLNKESKQLSIPIRKGFKNKQSQIYVPIKKHILLHVNNRHHQTKINKCIGESFGKIDKHTNGKTSHNTQKTTLEKIKLSELGNWYTYANFHKVQILNGIFNFIDKSNQEIKLIPQNERKELGIIEHENNVIEFTTAINKTFFNFFTEYDDKKDKNGNFTQVQTRTKQKILKAFYEIQALEFPIRMTNEKTIFIRPILIKGIETSSKKTFLTVEINTKILLLQSYNIERLSFFLVTSKDKIFKLNKRWDNKIKSIEKTNPRRGKFFKFYRVTQLKDLIIKGYNILQYNTHNRTPGYYIPVNISKDNWNNKILPEKRLNDHLKKNNHYRKSSKRIDTIETKNKLREALNELVFEILKKENCLKNYPKLINNTYKFIINPKEFNPIQAHKKILSIKSKIAQAHLK